MTESMLPQSKTWPCDRCKQPIGIEHPFLTLKVFREDRFWSEETGHYHHVWLEEVMIHASHMLGTGDVSLPAPYYYDPRIDGPRG